MQQNISPIEPTPAAALPETGYIRIKELLKFIPISRSTVCHSVKAGRFPKPVKLSQRVTAWHVNDIKAYIASLIDKG